MAPSLPSEPYVQLSLYTAQAISIAHRWSCEWQTKWTATKLELWLVPP